MLKIVSFAAAAFFLFTAAAPAKTIICDKQGCRAGNQATSLSQTASHGHKSIRRARVARHHRKVHRRPSNGDYGVEASSKLIPHPAGCPRIAFCACGASVRIFGRPIRELYRAAAWFRFPRSVAAPGMAAVRSHHVYIIEQVLSGDMVLATDYNSGGHLSRRHVVSLRGYRVVDPHGSEVYSARRHRVTVESHHIQVATSAVTW